MYRYIFFCIPLTLVP